MPKFHSSFVVPTRNSNIDSSNITVVILGARPINRAKSMGIHYLLPLNNHQTLLEYQLQEIRTSFPKSEVVFVGGYEIDRIIKKKFIDVRFVENLKYEDTNEIEDVRLALNCVLNKQVLFITNDAKYSFQTFNNITNGSTTIEYSVQNPTTDLIGIRSNSNYVECLSFHENSKWPGIIFLCHKELELLRQYASVRTNGSHFLFEAINYILTKRNIKLNKHTGNTGRILSIEDLQTL
jgi:CTP:phosphocholine cytidylyltransferase-like protein